MSLSPEPSAAGGQQPRRWNKRRLGLIGGAAVAVVGVASNISTVLDYLGIEPPTAVVQPAPTSPEFTPGPSTPLVPSMPVVGSCLTAAGDLTACDASHAAEVVSTGGCERQALRGYLGGADVDVLGPELDVTTATVSGDTVCTFAPPNGVQLLSPARDSLLERRGDLWRWCVDDDAQRNIPCDQPHTAEVVRAAGSGGAPLACSSAAEVFVGRPLDGERRLEIEQRVAGEQQLCVVSARGDNQLTASLRRLGYAALPVQST